MGDKECRAQVFAQLTKKIQGSYRVEAKLHCIEKSKGYSEMIIIDDLQETICERKHRNKAVI